MKRKTGKSEIHHRRQKKTKSRRRYTCAELMAKFKPEHRHPEWDVGPPVGKEIW